MRGGGVSIPIGFSNELQRSGFFSYAFAFKKFQSLSGFPMSCNLAFQLFLLLPPCFNPYRVFQ